MNRHRRITLTRLQWEGVYLLYWTLLLGVVYDIDAKGELSLLAAGAGVVISLGLLLTGFGKGVRIRYPQVRTNSGLQWGGEYVVGSGVFSLLVGVKTDLPASVIWGGFLLSFLLVKSPRAVGLTPMSKYKANLRSRSPHISPGLATYVPRSSVRWPPILLQAR